MTKRDFDLLAQEVNEFVDGTRKEPKALLAWFLVNVLRLDPYDVDDAICDGSNDKGVDALLVNEGLSEITILQGKYRVSHDKNQGDNDLKKLVGTAASFADLQSYDALYDSKPNPELKRLLDRQHVREVIEAGGHKVRLIAVTNALLDANAKAYMKTVLSPSTSLEAWDRSRLTPVARRVKRPELRPETIKLLAEAPPTVLTMTGDQKLAVAIIPAVQLVDLPGIEDLTLFDRNVRLFAGETSVNQDLATTVADSSEHRLFPAFHNGLTILTDKVVVRGKTLTLSKIGVVNGCQSLVTLRKGRAALSKDLRVIVKIVEVADNGAVADLITTRSNNQNGVTIRDQRSTDPVMRDLQATVGEMFGDEFALRIRLGEELTAQRILDNALAAQLLMAVYLQEPWGSVRKVRLFDHDFRRIFDERVTPHRLYLLSILDSAVIDAKPILDAELRASFASVRFTLVYLLAETVRLTDLGSEFLEHPERWLPSSENTVYEELQRQAREVVKSVNAYLKMARKSDELFDAKVEFKSKPGVLELHSYVVRLAEAMGDRDSSLLFRVAPTQVTTSPLPSTRPRGRSRAVSSAGKATKATKAARATKRTRKSK